MGNAPSNTQQEINVPAPKSKSKSSSLQPEIRQILQNWLQNVPFSLKSSQTEDISKAVRLLEVNDSKFLVRKGEEAAGIFVVVSGKIEVLSEGEKFVLREIPVGDFFGEVSVIYGTKCTASVRAAPSASLMHLKSEDAKILFNLPPEISLLDWFVKRRYIDSSGLFEGPKASQEIAFNVLSKAPVFQGWSDKPLKLIIESLKERPIMFYPAGSIIFQQGITGTEMYVLVHGRVQFKTKGQELAVFDAGDNGFCFGEEGLFTKSKRRSDVRALSPCQIIILSADNFYNALNKNPAEKMLLQMMHQKWKEHTEKRNHGLYGEYGGALDLEILRMALKQTSYFQNCPSGFVYIIALSTVVKEIKEEQAILSHKQYNEGHWLFLVLKGSAILVNEEGNTEEQLDVGEIFRKTTAMPSNAWVKANEVSIIALFPWSTISEALDAFPDVTLDQ